MEFEYAIADFGSDWYIANTCYHHIEWSSSGGIDIACHLLTNLIGSNRLIRVILKYYSYK